MSALQSGSLELRQFISFTGNILTVNLSAVPAGTTLPTPATVATAPGTLLTQIRIQVLNVIVSGGTTPSLLFSGTVMADNLQANPLPLVPSLFGNLTGRAAAVSLAYNSEISFPASGQPLSAAEPAPVS